MIHVVLFEPEIPPNTGNIIRLCANTGTMLHLVHPLGFELDNTRLQRAGLDYHELTCVMEHKSLEHFRDSICPAVMFAVSTRGKTIYSKIDYTRYENPALLFGPETRGLPADLLAGFPEQQILRVPMQPDSRSLNLSNTVAVIVYEILRQSGFRKQQ